MNTSTLPIFTCILCLAAAVYAVEPVQVRLQDRIGHDWKHELVHHALAFAQGELRGLAVARVENAAGEPVPCQVSDVVRDPEDGSIRSMNVWFFADVPPGGEAAYTISPGSEGAPDTTGVLVEQGDGVVELRTAAPAPIGIRLPLGARRFDWPVPASGVPGPIQGLLLPSGRQLGPGRIEAPFRVQSWKSELVASGPLFAEVRVHYALDAGYWTFRARVISGCPMIEIKEELDTGRSDARADAFDSFYTLPLTGQAFAPGQVFYGGRNSSPAHNDLLTDGVPELEGGAEQSVRKNWFANPVQGFTFKADEPRHDYSLSGYSAQADRVGCLVRYVQPGGDAVGFAALDTSYWRNPLALRCAVSAAGEAVLRLPLQMHQSVWRIDGWEEGSPNYTGVLRFCPENTLRRAYGIMLTAAEDETEAKLASLFYQAGKLGHMPLDRIKDWVLDWPDPMAGADWTAESTEHGTRALETMRAKVALKRAFGNFATFSMGYHYGYAKGVYPHVRKVMDDPEAITAAEREELRRLCAFYAYDVASLDTFPYGMGFHLNNPNMTIMAVEARAKSSSLIQDHPMFAEWGAWTRELMREYFTRFTMPSGAPYENPHYTLGVTMNWAIQANELLMDAGIGDALDSELFNRSMHFVLNWLTPPDPRFNGHRVVLPIGNCSYQSVPQDFTERFVAYYRERDPELAARLQWFGNQTMPEDKQVALVQEQQPALRSGWFEDYGVIFRHGFGTPYETLMHILAGECHGHYEIETDQMAYTIYAKGQPIHLHFGNGYFPMFNRPWLRNRVSFDMKMEAPERYRIAVEHASFMPEAEYFRAVREFEQLLPRGAEYPVLDEKNRWTPEESESWRIAMEKWDQPESFVPLTIWNRQMMFVKDKDPKGPNYFVLRDTFGGKPTVPTDLNLWFLADSMEREGDVFRFNGQCDVDMDVFVNTPAAFQPHFDEYGHQQQPYGRYTGFDPDYHPGGKRWESQKLLRLRRPAGEDYLVVLYPRLEGEAAASFERLAPNVVAVQTPIARDYIMLDSFPFTFEDENVRFSGMACAVRFYNSGKVVVANSEGDASVTAAGGTISGSGPFEIVLEGGER